MMQDCKDKLSSPTHLNLEIYRIEESTLSQVKLEYQMSPSPYISPSLATVPIQITCGSNHKYFQKALKIHPMSFKHSSKHIVCYKRFRNQHNYYSSILEVIHHYPKKFFVYVNCLVEKLLWEFASSSQPPENYLLCFSF